MRNLILSLLLTVTMSGYSQGKVYNLDKEKEITYTATGDYAIYHEAKLPVYMTKKGRLFIFVTSKKTGKPYRKYING